MKRSQLPQSIALKLWDIQRLVAPVETVFGDDGDDAARYMPADKVFGEIRRQLQRRQLMTVPSLIESWHCPGGLVKARIGIEITDLETRATANAIWEGESESLAGASTTALKGWYAATFLIRPEPPSDEALHAQRARRARENPTVTSPQIKRLIEPARAKSGLTDTEFAVMLRERFGVEKLEQLPRKHTDALVIALRSYRLKAAPVPIAAGPDKEPRDG